MGACPGPFGSTPAYCGIDCSLTRHSRHYPMTKRTAMMIGHCPPSNGVAMQFRYKYTRSYRDRHGKLRIEYRRNGRIIALPSTPGTAEFQAAYDAAHTSVEMSGPATTPVSSVPVQGSW